MRIVIIGGSGLVGNQVGKKLTAAGHEVVSASPQSGVNTITGEGLAEALKNTQVVVDVSNSPSWADDDVLKFFTTSTGNLLAQEKAAGVAYHVAVSIVGLEASPTNGYFRAKLAQEKLIMEGRVPYTIIRSTQFFEFAGGIADAGTQGSTVHIAPVQFQPIASADVAAAVARVAVAPPANGTVEIAGPEIFRFDEFVRRYLAAKNDPRQVVPDTHAPYFGSEVAERSLVPVGSARLGDVRFEDWLKQSVLRAHA